MTDTRKPSISGHVKNELTFRLKDAPMIENWKPERMTIRSWPTRAYIEVSGRIPGVWSQPGRSIKFRIFGCPLTYPEPPPWVSELWTEAAERLVTGRASTP